MTYTGVSSRQVEELLAEIGVKSVAELFSNIPEQIRLKRMLDLPAGLDDISLEEHLQELAGRNQGTDSLVSFLGAGSYDHFVPPVVDALAGQSAFVTAYTPYQAETSQGALQAFYEYQTLICEITGMDVSNASMYEAGSAVAEAVLMARDLTMRTRVLVGGNVHPEYVQVLRTYLAALPVKVEIIPTPRGMIDPADLAQRVDNQTAAVVIQQPDFFGLINPLDKIAEITKKHEALLIAAVDPISLGLLAPPGKFGVDIVVGEGQPLGNRQNLGGPYLGFMATKEKYLRRLPGRIIGATVDAEGKRAFCLTLQTREQHIRRERATSNICSNEGLLAIRAAIYLAAMGRTGFGQLANLCFQKAHYAAGQISKLKGYELAFSGPFFKEFVVRCKWATAEKVIQAARAEGILAGIDLGRWFTEFKDCVLVAVTEKRTKKQIDKLISILDSIK